MIKLTERLFGRIPNIWLATKNVFFFFFSFLMYIIIIIYGHAKKSVMPLFIFWIIFLLDLELNFIGKLLVFRWELILLLLLQICFIFFLWDRFHSLSRENQADIIEAFNSTSRYLDDLLNIDNIYFDQMVDRIYPTELQLNRTNSSDTEAPFLDLNLCISNGTVSTKIYDKRDDFDFDIQLISFPFSGWRCPPAYLIWGIHISTY